MLKTIICPECKSYEQCKIMGWADAVDCKNFEKPIWLTKSMVNAHVGSNQVLLGVDLANKN